MKVKDVPDNNWFMTREKKWYKKSHHAPKKEIVIATQIGNPKIFQFNENEEVQLRV